MNFITLMEGYFYGRNKNKYAVSGVFGAGRANENKSFPGKIHTPQYYHFGDLRNCFYTNIANSINIIASRYDGKKTMHYCLLCFLVGPVTLGIAAFVWFHNISNRIGNELRRRGIDSDFSASDFWLWNVLGSLILVGPFVYVYKLCNAANKVCEHYNING